MLGITGILVEEDVDHDAPTVNFKQLHRLNGPPRTGRLKLCLVAKWKTALVAPNPRISTNERTCSQAASQCRAPRTQTLKRAWGSCVSLHEASRGADIVGPCSILRAVAGRSRSEKSVPGLSTPTGEIGRTELLPTTQRKNSSYERFAGKGHPNKANLHKRLPPPSGPPTEPQIWPSSKAIASPFGLAQ